MANEDPARGTPPDDDISMFLENEEPEQDDDADDPDGTPEAESVEDDADEDVEAAEAEDADEDAESDPEDDDDPLVTVKTDKGEQEIRFSELQKGYLRQQDYTRKTQEAAELRKALEGEKSGISEQRERLQAALTQWVIDTPRPNWVELAQKMTPQQFQMAQAQYAQRAQKAEEAKAALAELRAEEVARERDVLLEKIPEWKDQAVAKAELEGIVSLATEYGFTRQELGAVSDHRILQLLRDATQLRKLRAGNAAAKKKVADSVKSVPPAAKTTKSERVRKQRQQATDRFKANPSDEQAFVDWMLTG